MSIIRTDLSNLKENARRLRFEASTTIPRKDVQRAIEYIGGLLNASLTQVTSAQSISVGASDAGYELTGGVAGQVSFTFPTAASRNGLPILIIDAGGVFFTYNGLVTLQSGETVRGSQTMILDGNYGYYLFKPRVDNLGYNLLAGN